MRFTVRLNPKKDNTLLNILINIPEGERSEVARIALRNLFGIEKRSFTTYLSTTNTKPISSEATLTIPKLPITQADFSEAKLDEILRKL